MTTSKQNALPWDEGKLAALNGEPRSSCPYSDDAEEAQEWNAGYDSVFPEDDEIEDD